MSEFWLETDFQSCVGWTPFLFLTHREVSGAMEGFACSAERLVRWFKKSRDQWKARATEKQKRIKSLNVKVRDLLSSRDHWKMKAKQLQDQIESSRECEPGPVSAATDSGNGSRPNALSGSERTAALIPAPPFSLRRHASTASTPS